MAWRPRGSETYDINIGMLRPATGRLEPIMGRGPAAAALPWTAVIYPLTCRKPSKRVLMHLVNVAQARIKVGSRLVVVESQQAEASAYTTPVGADTQCWRTSEHL